MNNVSITVSTTDNRTQAYGYSPEFYKDENARNRDIRSDMLAAEEYFGDVIAIIAVAEWNNLTENSNGIVYNSIAEVLEAYPAGERKDTED